MRIEAVLVCSLWVGACQGDPAPPPPPIDNDPTIGPVTLPMGMSGAAPSTSATTEGTGPTDGSGDTTGREPLPTGSGSGSGSGTSAQGPLLSGQLLDGPTGLVPDTCRIRMHTLDSIDPGSGLPVDTAAEITATIQALPQMYVVDSVPGGAIGVGDEVYVSALCDVDGDGVLDNLGAYYPQIPLESVVLPAMGVDMTLDFVL